MFEHVYYINLEKSKDRRVRIEHEIHKAKLKATRVDAIYGPGLAKEDFAENATSTCADYCNRRLIGCGLSHIKAWRMFLASPYKQALFLEDDAVIHSTDLKKDLAALVPQDADVVMVGSFINMGSNPVINGFFSLQNYGRVKQNKPVQTGVVRPSYTAGLHGYMLNRRAAERMVKYFEQEKLFTHIDTQLNHLFDKGDLNVYSLNPPLITQRTNLHESNIVQYQFPMTLNYIFDRIENKDHISVGYVMNLSTYETTPSRPEVSLQVNGWLYVFFVLGVLIKWYKIDVDRVAMVFAAVFLFEYAISRSHQMIVPATVYYLLLVGPTLLT